jgi:mannose-1-phosphate guanylyltransferase
MKLVLLSGGSGKRLWPLSNDSRSKQFLKVLEGKEELQSMVQRVWSQLENVELDESSIIATGKSQVEMIHSQLGRKVNLIIEPERKDTFPAIALAATYLNSIENISPEEVIVVLPVDPYVEDDFFLKIKELEDVLIDSNADIALIGITATFPSEKYGYIVPNKKIDDMTYYSVEKFKEKPSREIAEKLIEQGSMWNSGVFAFKLGTILNKIEEKNLPINYNELIEAYSHINKTSFDYEIVEKAEKIVVLPYNGYWKDLGTWNTLSEEMVTEVVGNAVKSKDSSNTHIINELDTPICVLGLSNIIVAASPDGILVTDKESSPRIKELVGDLNNRPMYEERRWGWYKVLDYVKVDNGNEVLTKRIKINTGRNLSYHHHNFRQEVWTVIKGEGLLYLNNVLKVIRQGDVIEIPKGINHAVKAISDLEIIEVQTGSELVEEDNHRLLFNWEEIEKEAFARTMGK